MTDKEIFGLYMRRDENAIAETERKYGALLHSIAFNVTGSREDAEEAVGDALLACWKGIPPEPASLAAFVGCIVRRKAVDLRRKKKESFIGLEPAEELIRSIPAGNNVEDEVAAKELAALIDGWLDTLSVRDRTLFVRRYWECCPITELSADTGEPIKRLYRRLAALRKKLKTYLEKEGYAK